MKKVLCLIDSLRLGGGAERQMIGLATFLKSSGYDIDLVSYYNHDSYAELSQQSGINVTILQAKENKLSKLMAVKRYLKSIGGCDCVIAYKDGPTIIGCLLKLLGGQFRLIVSERNTTQVIRKKDKLKFMLYRWADYIVPNAHAQEEFIKINFPKLGNKVVTITNFTDTAHFCPAEEEINDKVSILTVARVASQKNILNYLEAIKLLKQDGFADKVHFNWFGAVQPGEEAYGAVCFKKRIDLGVEDMIEFHPATKEIVKQYQRCDIFCLPSMYEGFPNVVCEAMCCGKPIVCSRVCDNPRIVQENINGLLFDPNDVNSIYSTLKQIIEMSQSQLKEWGKSSRDIAELKFSKEAFVQKYINLIED